MTVLTPSHSPSSLLAAKSTTLTSTSTSQVAALLSPALSHSLTFAALLHRFLSATSLSLALRLSLLSSLLLRQSLSASQFFAVNAYLTCAGLARRGVWSARLACRTGWKALEPLRNKLFFEFMVFVLGCGNALCLVLFWPGWILVAGGLWALWRASG